jgi:hypothetical protein
LGVKGWFLSAEAIVTCRLAGETGGAKTFETAVVAPGKLVIIFNHETLSSKRKDG